LPPASRVLPLNTDLPSLALEPASLWRRLAALCYDLLLLAALAVCFTLAVLALRLGTAVPPGSWWFAFSLLAIAMVFFSWFWVNGGQTLGMRAWRIRVVRVNGRGLKWPRAAARFAAALVAALPAGLGLWWSVFDSRKRGWHDCWTDTRVIRVETVQQR
jgi:uncharacterized RDD family membrane protein YckC